MKSCNIENLLSGELISNKVIDVIFNSLEEDLLDKRELELDFKSVSFISVYFLERLENFVIRAKDLQVNIKLFNVSPGITKVFRVARIKPA